MAGYKGFSMSNNAVEAYLDGERPLSKWTKADIMQSVKDYANDCAFDFDTLSKLTVKEMKLYFLKQSSWHHTSSKYNVTNFYSLNTDYIDDLTNDKINNIISARLSKLPKKEEGVKMTALVCYTEWIKRKAIDHEEVIHYLSADKMVETKAGNKRLSSLTIYFEKQGTFTADEMNAFYSDFLKEKELERVKRIEDKRQQLLSTMTKEAKEWFLTLNWKYESSFSGNIYAYDRKPSSYDYNNLSAFFKVGENRIATVDGKLVLQVWNGAEWNVV